MFYVKYNKTIINIWSVKVHIHTYVDNRVIYILMEQTGY